MTKKLLLVLVSIWWGWTVLIDFTVIPVVFSIVENFFNAGELGITLFSRLNTFELILSSLLLLTVIFPLKNVSQQKWQLGLSLAAWAIVMIYFAYLTPKISALTQLWQKAEAQGLSSIAGITDVQQEHQYYHRLYVGLDSLKLFLLSAIMGLQLFAKESAFEKA